MNRSAASLSPKELSFITEKTIAHYDADPIGYRDGTSDHDVRQNYDALLDSIEGDGPYCILDLGCGPGRDIRYFSSLGHEVVGLEGSKAFVKMAESSTDCEVLHQDLLKMEITENQFDGVFANAVLFHVPSQELPRVLKEINQSLKTSGTLFSSNPRGNNQEGWNGDRYGCFYDLETWRNYVTEAGFEELDYFYRPEGVPFHHQPWLASVWRKI